MRRNLRATSVVIAVLALASSCKRGGEGERCFPNATCDDGLTCVSGRCVSLPGTDATATTDAQGADSAIGTDASVGSDAATVSDGAPTADSGVGTDGAVGTDAAPPPGSGGVVGVALLFGETDSSGIAVVLSPSGALTMTDASGSYAFAGIAAGIYSAQFSAAGFATTVVDDVVVAPGFFTVPDVLLTRGAFVTGDVSAFGIASPDGQWFLVKATSGLSATVAADGASKTFYSCRILGYAPNTPTMLARPDSLGFWCASGPIPMFSGLSYLDPVTGTETIVDPDGYSIYASGLDPARVIYRNPSAEIRSATPIGAPLPLLPTQTNLRIGGGLVTHSGGTWPAYSLEWVLEDASSPVVSVPIADQRPAVPAPDGSLIAWAASDATALWTALPDGTGVAQLYSPAPPELVGEPQFAAGSSLVVFPQYGPTNTLRSCPALGGAPTTLLAGGVSDWYVTSDAASVLAWRPGTSYTDVYFGSVSSPLGYVGISQFIAGSITQTFWEHPDGVHFLVSSAFSVGYEVVDGPGGIISAGTLDCRVDSLSAVLPCVSSGVLYALDISTGGLTAVDAAPLGYNVPGGFVYLKGTDLFLYTP